MSRSACVLIALLGWFAASACEKKNGTTDSARENTKSIPPPEDVAAPPPDAERTESGLAYKVLRASTSTIPPPDANDSVTVHYTGWTTDGKMFDSSVARGSTQRFSLASVIPGWREGVQMMRIGEKRRLWIPEELAYAGAADGPQGTLVFDVELLEIIAVPDPYPPPPDLASPPPDAVQTASGLRYKILAKGSGGARPNADSIVTVEYTGWTSDGKLFDSSRLRPIPPALPLGRLMPGWREGVQLMSVGDEFRFWIPEHLAFAGRDGAPSGMLVFDVALRSIQ